MNVRSYINEMIQALGTQKIPTEASKQEATAAALKKTKRKEEKDPERQREIGRWGREGEHDTKRVRGKVNYEVRL